MTPTQINTVLTGISILQMDVHQLAVSKRWWDGRDIQDPNHVGSLLMLVVSELGEAMEAVRRSYPLSTHEGLFMGNFEEELADAVIRLMDLSEAMGINLGNANRSRPDRHGGKLL